MPRARSSIATSAVCGAVIAIGASGAASASVAPAKAATLGVGRTTLHLVDRTRPTPANGPYPGAPSRTLDTMVSYPTRAGKPLRGSLPLVVFATGIEGTATNYAPLYDHWVRAGYVVAAPAFPLSRKDAPGGPSAGDIAGQAGDLHFVTTEVLRAARAKGSVLHGLIDPRRIGVAGKSLGAITVFQAAYNPAVRDPRFRAVIAMTGLVTDGVDFTKVGTPLLLEHGDADRTVPINGSRDAYARAQAPKFFVTLFGATHGSAFGGGTSPSELVVERTTLDFLDRYLKRSALAQRRLERDGNVTGVASLAVTAA